MMVNGSSLRERDLEYNTPMIKTNMKDIGKMIKNKEKEYSIKGEIVMKDNFRTVSSTALSLH
jgi:hypothetical protein